MERYDYGVVIGRFQPFHNMHLELLRRALAQCDRVIVVIGSCNVARTVKNPWTGDEREIMIRACFRDGSTHDEFELDENRLRFVHARDYLYNDTLWLTAIQEQVYDQVFPGDDKIALFGHKKDESSFYLRYFPQWSFVDVGRLGDVDATHVRELMFRHDLIGVKHLVPAPTYDAMTSFFQTGQQWTDLKSEFDHYVEYRARWKGAPFPPTFVTVDTVVTCSGHVLLVKRGYNPGKGLLALPGGFLDQRERIVDGALRELREETGIKVATNDLKDMIVDQKVFDHPDRSLRGRTITHAFHIDLSRRFQKPPLVKGGDDAAKAFWMPLLEVFSNEAMFFDDHAHVIRAFALKL